MSGTICGGVAITAKSGVTGRLAISGYVGTSSITRYFGLTGMMCPLKPAVNRLCVNTAPTEDGRVLAPMSVADLGLNRNSRFRMVTFIRVCLHVANA